MTNDNDEQRIHDRIKALLNTGENHASTEGEVRNAMRFAKSLMDKHHLTEADLATEPEDQMQAAKDAERGRYYAFVTTKHYQWEYSLAYFVRDLVGGVKVYSENRQKTARHPATQNVLLNARDEPYRAKAFCFYGIAEDARIAAETYHELRLTVIGMARLKYGGIFKGEGGMYCQGFVQGLFRQLDDGQNQERIVAKERMDGGEGTNAIVLLERRNALVEFKEDIADEFLASEGIKLHRSSGSYGATGSSGAYGRGKADGAATSTTVSRQRKLN